VCLCVCVSVCVCVCVRERECVCVCLLGENPQKSMRSMACLPQTGVWPVRQHEMILLLLFLQKQSLASQHADFSKTKSKFDSQPSHGSLQHFAKAGYVGNYYLHRKLYLQFSRSLNTTTFHQRRACDDA